MGSAFKGTESLIESGRRCVKSRRQPGARQGRGNFFHLADVTPRLGDRNGGGLHAAALEVRLRERPFLKQRLVHAFARC